MSRKHVLLVGGVDFMVDKLVEVGVRFSMAQIPRLVDDRHAGAAERYAVVDYTDEAEILALARSWHAIDPFDAVVSFTEYGLEPASLCAEDLGVAGNNLQAVRLTRDKTRTRELLARHGLSPVRYRVCANLDDAQAFLDDVGGPIVLKPADRGLSEGVVRVDGPAELGDRWAATRAAADGVVLAEELLVGPEYSVESLSVDGRHEVVMVTEKVTTPPPRFVELGHQLPARLDAASRAAMEGLVTTLLDLVGQRTGPAHTEVCLTAAGPRLIESQTRAGGDQIWEMCRLVTGVDLIGETVTTLVGLPPRPREPVAKAAAIRFFGYENARVARVDGVADAARLPGAYRVVCSLEPGRRLGPLLSSDSRQGYALCVGDGTDEAIAAAEAALDRVRVEWEPLGTASG